MKLTVGELRKIIHDVDDAFVVVFQGNIHGEEIEDEPKYTTCLGYAYSAFPRNTELVIDCAITDKES